MKPRATPWRAPDIGNPWSSELGALVFVTTELSPFTAGGIGRVLHNMLKSMAAGDRQRACVLALDCKIGKAEFAAVFPSVRLIVADSDEDEGRHEISGHQPPRRGFDNTTDHQWKSSVVFRALRTLSRGLAIDYVEFPDFGGLGFATVQEKKISGFLAKATLAVRLHSTHAVLLQHEAYLVNGASGALADMERKTLRDCDLLIAQLLPVGERMRQVLGFDRSEWEPRLVVHAPPVLLDTCGPKAETIAATNAMTIMFGSKIQRVKRPDLFVRGVSAFCRRAPEYSGDIIISAHNVDRAYSEIVKRLVAPDLMARFHFVEPTHSPAREPLIASCTFVVPSDFEAFCLAAYEASLLGARLIVNDANPAFGEGTPWIDGVNCYKFDGTSLGLQKVLKRNFEDRDTLRPVVPPSDPWPWTQRKPPAQIQESDDLPLVSVVIPHFNLGGHLVSTLMSVLEQTYENIEIVLVDDCSTDARSRALIDDLYSHVRAGMKVVIAPGNLGLAGARNLGIAHAAGEYIVPVDADDLLDRRFIEVSVRALERNPDFDVFVTPAAYFRDGDSIVVPGESADFEHYMAFVGEALISGFPQNRFSTATACFRGKVLHEYGYVESLRCYEDWNLYLRLAHDGRRFLVANDVYFHYRNRPDSMSKAVRDLDAKALFIHDALRTAVNLERVTPLAYLAFCLSIHPPEPLPPPQPQPSQPPPQQLEPQPPQQQQVQPQPPAPQLPEPEPPESQPREWQPLPRPQAGPLDVAAPPLAKRIEDKVKEFAFRRLEAFPRTRSVVRKVYRLLRPR